MTKTELLQLLGNEYQTNGGKYDNPVIIGSTMQDIQMYMVPMK